MAEQPLQDNEGQALLAFFEQSPKGFFVEVGLRGPTDGSRTFTLEAAGWTGVLAEPLPDVAAFLVTVRKAAVVACACVAPDVAGQPLELRVDSPLAAVDIGRRTAGASSSYVISVPTRALDDILEEADAPQPLDVLVLDVHGRELDALLGFDFAHWRPKLIAIADPVFDWDRHRFLMAIGYRLIRRVGGCGWYVPEGASAQPERLAILRDYYLLLPIRKARRALRRLGARIAATAD